MIFGSTVDVVEAEDVAEDVAEAEDVAVGVGVVGVPVVADGLDRVCEAWSVRSAPFTRAVSWACEGTAALVGAGAPAATGEAWADAKVTAPARAAASATAAGTILRARRLRLTPPLALWAENTQVSCR
jgi:hypothetical protein